MASKNRQANGSAMDDAEFEKLLDEMDELGRQADVLREKVNHLIDEMRENDVAVEEDKEAAGEVDASEETGGDEDQEEVEGLNGSHSEARPTS